MWFHVHIALRCHRVPTLPPGVLSGYGCREGAEQLVLLCTTLHLSLSSLWSHPLFLVLLPADLSASPTPPPLTNTLPNPATERTQPSKKKSCFASFISVPLISRASDGSLTGLMIGDDKLRTLSRSPIRSAASLDVISLILHRPHLPLTLTPTHSHLLPVFPPHRRWELWTAACRGIRVYKWSLVVQEANPGSLLKLAVRIFHGADQRNLYLKMPWHCNCVYVCMCERVRTYTCGHGYMPGWPHTHHFSDQRVFIFSALLTSGKDKARVSSRAFVCVASKPGSRPNRSLLRERKLEHQTSQYIFLPVFFFYRFKFHIPYSISPHVQLPDLLFQSYVGYLKWRMFSRK